jgi:hypothetical protein
VSELAARVVAVLQRRRPHARFVPELARQLGVPAIELEAAMMELEANGSALVREQYCADPHLEGMDLRIVALIEPTPDGDAIGAASTSIDNVWQRWLGEYLANHRCT